ncbi:Ubiquitin carboxyl-terminal hydrolase 43 [Cricetulus griseus]|uniref:ubiquitinyl hydrolase 1 n=1 Tax=Cricetulus griseus TaxID=10029 RepID=G3GZ30_CRIGR|nr:Ubiquitin carboxyl-terminal hydrolase 43 [Cricetulus griseus]
MMVIDLGTLFSIRVVGLSLACSYLSPQDSRPLCHWAVDRALHLRRPGGPPHVKLAVEWDSSVTERLFGSLQEERVQDADSVWRQQQAHQQPSCTLDEWFQSYTKGEQLAQDDAWKCPHCQVLQQGVVKLSLWTLPDILIIHLKRFCQVGEKRNKLSTLVKFPLSGLNMAPHVALTSTNSKTGPGPWSSWKQPICLPTTYPMDFLYDLYAVCNHHGSLQGGHYTAYCRNSLDGQWYSYDDSTVEPLREDEVNTRGAYILFYQKRNSIPPWSASSSMRGSTSSSLSDHWLMRLGSHSNSTRGSLLSWSSAPCPSVAGGPDSPVFTNGVCHQDKDDGLNTARIRTGNANQDIKLPKKFDLPLTVMPSVGDEKPARPEGQKMTTWKGSGQVGSQSSPPSPSTGLLRNFKDNGPGTLPKMKARAAVEERAPDKDKGQGTFTLLKSVFWKKEHKRAVRVENSPTAPPVSLVSDRLNPAMNEQARGSSPALRIRESPARGLGYHMERDIRSAPSSLHLPRKASRPPRASTAGTSQKTIPGEQNSYGTLQRVKYHTLSLGRKKSLPESSF